MRVTPIEERRPVNEPRGVDIVAGAALSSPIFASLTAVSITTWAALAGQSDPGWLLLWLIFSLVYASFVSFLVALLWGVPMSLLVARLARRSSDWRVHLAAYMALGAFTGAVVWIVGGLASGSNRLPEFLPGDQIPWMLATAAITAVATAAGWATIWCASRAEPGLDTPVYEDSRAEDALIEEAQG